MLGRAGGGVRSVELGLCAHGLMCALSFHHLVRIDAAEKGKAAVQGRGKTVRIELVQEPRPPEGASRQRRQGAMDIICERRMKPVPSGKKAGGKGGRGSKGGKGKARTPQRLGPWLNRRRAVLGRCLSRHSAAFCAGLSTVAATRPKLVTGGSRLVTRATKTNQELGGGDTRSRGRSGV